MIYTIPLIQFDADLSLVTVAEARVEATDAFDACAKAADSIVEPGRTFVDFSSAARQEAAA